MTCFKNNFRVVRRGRSPGPLGRTFSPGLLGGLLFPVLYQTEKPVWSIKRGRYTFIYVQGGSGCLNNGHTVRKLSPVVFSIVDGFVESVHLMYVFLS